MFIRSKNQEMSMICRVCKSSIEYRFTHTVLGKYNVKYFYCSHCGLLQTEKPYWLEESYASPIAVADTGIIQRNLYLSRLCTVVLYFLFSIRSKYIDLAGGYGIFVRLMRDYGFDFYWNDKYTENKFALGFSAEEPIKGYAVATAFEVMEHLEEPMLFLQEVMEKHGIETLLFSTELYDGAPPNPSDWWYYSFGTGQHISFYKKETFELMAERLGCRFIPGKYLHILTKKKISSPIFRMCSHPVFFIPVFSFIKKRLKSKTMSDYYYLIGERD
jgi:hypothetical protein